MQIPKYKKTTKINHCIDHIFFLQFFVFFPRPIYHDWHVVMILFDQSSPTHDKEELNSCKPIAEKTRLYKIPKQSLYCHVILWQQFECLSNIF